MIKAKKNIIGKIISPTKIRIINTAKSELIPGQKVLLYQTTNHNVISLTGKILGKKERVIGVGKVDSSGRQLVIEKDSQAYTLKPYINNYIKQSRKKSMVKSFDPEGGKGIILIKPIEE